MPRLSVVIPAYNEASRIERTLDRTVEFLDARDDSWEIVVADDGSRDHTAEIVQRYIKTHGDAAVRLVALPQNRGKGAALRAGVAATRGERVLLMDADLATPIEELETLSRALDRGYKVATGSRAVSTSNVTRAQSPLRVLLGRAGNLWIRSLAVPGVHDTQCGFKLFEGDVARQLFARCREDRFGIDIEVLCLARRRLGLDIAEVGIRWEHQEGSKVRPKDYLDVLIKVPRIVWNVMRSRP
jgi:dolichyl-phosphate beta-glucosyltransferase